MGFKKYYFFVALHPEAKNEKEDQIDTTIQKKISLFQLSSRVVIESTISHVKRDSLLGLNFLKGLARNCMHF